MQEAKPALASYISVGAKIICELPGDGRKFTRFKS